MSCRFRQINPAFSAIPDSGSYFTTDQISPALQEVGAQLAQIGTQQYARVYNSAAQSIADATDVHLAFNSERADTNGLHDTVTNNSRLTCKSAGVYFIMAVLYWDTAVDAGLRIGALRLNGTTVIASVTMQNISGQYVKQYCSTVYALEVNDYIEVRARQTSGGSLNIMNSGSAQGTDFAMVRVA